MKSPQTPLPFPAQSSVPTFNISRRVFLQRCTMIAAVTGLPLWFVERQQLGAAEKTRRLGPNDRPGIALVGCGGMGKGDAKNASNYGDILAVCDVDEGHAAAAAEMFKAEGRVPTIYHDFRKVMERDDIHIIVNATPDHWHTLVNLAAAKAHKDIYGEKPLTLTVDEGRHMIAAVRDNGVVLQTGTQQRSTQRFRMACELIRNGRLGKLQQARVWLPAGLRAGPFKPSPVPAGLDWDFWQGQAPAADYVTERCHGTFRFWYEYSGGTMTDWGAHHNDIAQWGLGMDGSGPVQVESTCLWPRHREPNCYNCPPHFNITYTYGKDASTYCDGTRLICTSGGENGVKFNGEGGWIFVSRGTITASEPKILNEPLPSDAVRLYKSDDHMRNFLNCVKTREKPICDIEVGFRSVTVCHLGNISLRLGRTLKWDPVKERFFGDALANEMISRKPRSPWKLEV